MALSCTRLPDILALLFPPSRSILNTGALMMSAEIAFMKKLQMFLMMP
jgi:hypothetical protein